MSTSARWAAWAARSAFCILRACRSAASGEIDQRDRVEQGGVSEDEELVGVVRGLLRRLVERRALEQVVARGLADERLGGGSVGEVVQFTATPHEQHLRAGQPRRSVRQVMHIGDEPRRRTVPRGE